MLDIFKKWYRRYLFEEESVLLLVLLTIGIALLMSIGHILSPVLAALVLAFLMEGISTRLQRYGAPGWLGVTVAYVVFVGSFFAVVLGLLPLVWRHGLAARSPVASALHGDTAQVHRPPR